MGRLAARRGTQSAFHARFHCSYEEWTSKAGNKKMHLEQHESVGPHARWSFKLFGVIRVKQ